MLLLFYEKYAKCASYKIEIFYPESELTAQSF